MQLQIFYNFTNMYYVIYFVQFYLDFVLIFGVMVYIQVYGLDLGLGFTDQSLGFSIEVGRDWNKVQNLRIEFGICLYLKVVDKVIILYYFGDIEQNTQWICLWSIKIYVNDSFFYWPRYYFPPFYLVPAEIKDKPDTL